MASVDVVRDVTHMEAVARVRLCATPALVRRVFIAANVIPAVHEVVAHVAHPFVVCLDGVVRVRTHLQVQVKVVAAARHAVRQRRWLFLHSEKKNILQLLKENCKLQKTRLIENSYFNFVL